MREDGAMPAAYDDQNIFAKILRKEIPADVVYEDDVCLAFRDVNPQAPTHLLVIPREPIARLADAGRGQRAVLGHLLWAAGEIARRAGLAEDGFRVVVNNGERAGQTVFHLHVHVLGGRALRWPPG
jgi:histidine triad (HIT) family protein